MWDQWNEVFRKTLGFAERSLVSELRDVRNRWAHNEAFTSNELKIVRNLSNMAAADLENVELFYRVRTDQEQLRAILASSSDGIAIVGGLGEN